MGQVSTRTGSRPNRHPFRGTGTSCPRSALVPGARGAAAIHRPRRRCRSDLAARRRAQAILGARPAYGALWRGGPPRRAFRAHGHAFPRTMDGDAGLLRHTSAWQPTNRRFDRSPPSRNSTPRCSVPPVADSNGRWRAGVVLPDSAWRQIQTRTRRRVSSKGPADGRPVRAARPSLRASAKGSGRKPAPALRLSRPHSPATRTGRSCRAA